MENEKMYNATYGGSKQFTQQDVKTANANGFAAAADDYAERGIDLNEQLILNKPATFFFRMNGDAMTGAGISSGDVLIVDRSIKATNGKIIIAAINGELVVRRLLQSFNHYALQAENSKYRDIPLNEFSDYSVWGVITCAIHIFEQRLFISQKDEIKSKKIK